MKREEAIKEFREKTAVEWIQKCNQAFDELFLEKQEEFAADLWSGFETLLESVSLWKAEQPDFMASCLTISYLQTGVTSHTYDWYMELQNEEMELDETERAVSFSMAAYFTPLEELGRDLTEAARPYFGVINQSDIENIQIAVYKNLRRYFSFAAIHAFRRIEGVIGFIWLEKAPQFFVTLGEYKGKKELLHVVDQRPGVKKALLEALVAPHVEGKPTGRELVGRDFTRASIRERQLALKNLTFANFSFVYSYIGEFLFCSLIGADFHHAILEKSSFLYCTLENACFEEATFVETQFFCCKLEQGEITGEGRVPGFYPVSFRYAVFEQVSFKDCDLRGCDFRGVEWGQVDFTESNLTGARFDEDALPLLNLTEEQKKGIRMVSKGGIGA